MKYKHKITGHVANQTNSGKNYKVSFPQNYTIPSWIVENSNDWEEVKETYPVGTKIIEKKTGFVLIKDESGWLQGYGDINESEIGEGKRFQLIEESKKAYEILSFYYKNIGGKGDSYVGPDYIWLKSFTDNSKWSRLGYMTTAFTTKEMLENSNFGIHSIRRLSDNEVFTIGDEIIDRHLNIFKPVKIQKFKLIDKDVLVGGKDFQTSLNHIQKEKTVLFTTEDGVEIRKGDKFYEANFLHGVKEWTTKYPVYINKDILKRLFSTKEAAKEYILMNSPSLSINNVKDYCNLSSYQLICLKQLVKSIL